MARSSMRFQSSEFLAGLRSQNKILEDLGVLGDVNVSELALCFLPLENDLLSLELDD